MVAFLADDPIWGQIGNGLLRGHDWDQYHPVVRAAVTRAPLAELLELVVPPVGLAMREEPTPGAFWAVVFADEGASLYQIWPCGEGAV